MAATEQEMLARLAAIQAQREQDLGLNQQPDPAQQARQMLITAGYPANAVDQYMQNNGQGLPVALRTGIGRFLRDNNIDANTFRPIIEHNKDPNNPLGPGYPTGEYDPINNPPGGGTGGVGQYDPGGGGTGGTGGGYQPGGDRPDPGDDVVVDGDNRPGSDDGYQPPGVENQTPDPNANNNNQPGDTTDNSWNPAEGYAHLADPNVANSEYPFNAYMADALGVYGPVEQLYLSGLYDWHQQHGTGQGAFGGYRPLQHYGDYGDMVADRAQIASWAMNDLGTWGQGRGKELANYIADQGVNKTQQTNLANRITAQFEDPNRVADVAAGELGPADQLNGINMRTVSEIANNPYLSGQIDAVNRDIARSLTEAGLPQNAMQAAGTGNTGSTRRGVMDAILTRGTQDRMGDVAAQMRSNAYQQGVGVSADQAVRNQAANLANQQMQFGANLQAALANQQAGLNLGNQQLTAANLAATIGQQGMGDILAGNNLNLGNWQAGLQTGLLDQALRQQEINADMQRWNFNQLSPFHSMELYKGILGLPGNTPWSSTQEGAGAGITASNANLLGQAALGMGANLIGGGQSLTGM